MPISPQTPSTATIVGIAMFAVGAFLALEVFALGFVSLILNRDVVTDPRAGIAVGLVMILGAMVTLVTGLLRVALRRSPSVRILSIVVIVLGSYAGYLVAGLVGWALFASGDPGEGFFFILGMSVDWPSLVVLLNATIVTLAFFATLSYRDRRHDPFDPRATPG
jgi:hypothetical protein